MIVSAGGAEGRSLVAYDAATGEPVWAGGHDVGSYSSPQLVTLAGRRQVVIFNQGSVAGHDLATGSAAVGACLPQRAAQRGPAPAPARRPPAALRGLRRRQQGHRGRGRRPTAPWRAGLVWESPRLKSKFANIVFHEGFVYGLDDGVLTCLDPATRRAALEGGPLRPRPAPAAGRPAPRADRRGRAGARRALARRRIRELTRFTAAGGQDLESARSSREPAARAQRPRGGPLRAARRRVESAAMTETSDC